MFNNNSATIDKILGKRRWENFCRIKFFSKSVKMSFSSTWLLILFTIIVGFSADILSESLPNTIPEVCKIRPPSFCQPEVCYELGIISKLPTCVSDPNKLSLGRQIPGSIFLEKSDMLPSWANLTLARLGQKFAYQYPLTMFLSGFYGFNTGFAVPDIRDGFRFAAKYDKTLTPFKKLQHVLAANVQGFLWHDEPITNNTIDNPWLASLSNVRYKHLKAAYFANKYSDAYHKLRKDTTNINLKYRPFWQKLDKILNSSSIPLELRKWPPEYLEYENPDPLPINQFSLSIAQYSNVGFILTRRKGVYLPKQALNDEEGLYGLVHLWALIGHAYGVADEFNSCLQPDVESARQFYIKIHRLILTPAIFQMTDATRELLEHLFLTLAVDHEPLARSFNKETIELFTQSFFLLFIRDHLKISMDPNQLSSLDYLVQKIAPPMLTTISQLLKIVPGSWNLTKSVLQEIISYFYSPDYNTNMKIAQNVFTYADYRPPV